MEQGERTAGREDEASPTTVPPDVEISVHDKGQDFGPNMLGELRGYYQADSFTEDAVFWHEGMEDWAPLRNLFRFCPAPGAVRSSVRLFLRVWLTISLPDFVDRHGAIRD